MTANHPWLEKYPIKKDTKYLIIGTHPPMPYCGKLQYYYGNMNEFWRFLDKVYPGNNLYNNRCPELKDIQKFLTRVEMDITDMVEETDGTPFSIDDDMKWTKLNNTLKDLLIKGTVEKIYFTSFGGKNSALNLFKKWLKNKENGFKNIRIPDSKEWRSKGLTMQLQGKYIQLEVLFSPSPTARRSASRIGEYQKWQKENTSSSFDDFRIDWYKNKLPKGC
jgi:G:T/U-mismatch repair DNA glycosylase